MFSQVDSNMERVGFENKKIKQIKIKTKIDKADEKTKRIK